MTYPGVETIYCQVCGKIDLDQQKGDIALLRGKDGFDYCTPECRATINDGRRG